MERECQLQTESTTLSNLYSPYERAYYAAVSHNAFGSENRQIALNSLKVDSVFSHLTDEQAIICCANLSTAIHDEDDRHELILQAMGTTYHPLEARPSAQRFQFKVDNIEAFPST